MSTGEASTWLVLTGQADSETIIDRSRFLTRLHPLDDGEAASAMVAALRKAHPGARHHCTAMILGSDGAIQGSNDDGEPSGTAGQPMLEVLRRRQVTGVLAVVTRYFGGILLGAGGLVRAYSGAVATALDHAHATRLLARQELRVDYTLTLDPATAGREDHALRTWAAPRGGEVQVDYAARPRATITLPPALATDFEAFAASRALEARRGAPRTILTVAGAAPKMGG